MNVAIIGAGNLAWHLAPELENAGFSVRGVFSRNNENTKKLRERLYNATIFKNLDFSSSKISLFFLIVSDDALKDVCSEIILPESATIIHTSGAKSIEILDQTAADSKGVFYPVQTFKKLRKVKFKSVPICIEGSNSKTKVLLTDIAKRLQGKVLELNSEKRKALHVAAVFACNFTNYMLTMAEEICGEEEIPFDTLKPLIIETIEKSLLLGSDNAQTGPAIRNDIETLAAHNEYLDAFPEAKKIYGIISQHIMDYYDL